MAYAQPSVQTSLRLSPEFYDLAKTHNIVLSEAMRVGVSILLAEKGVKEYDNNLNIMRRLDKLSLKLNETLRELEELKAKHGITD